MRKTDEEYKPITKAKIRDIEYFLGKDWIDYKSISKDIMIEMYREVGISTSQPKKCPLWEQYWHMEIRSQNYKVPKYLEKDIFGGLPVIKEVCERCQ